ncbi:TetR/AcrR family transcriptional regulator [Sphaerisporangium corydalis]|uniref:TetR/AcrR family transcriptional regulator n=1 Tax=Sphaerisporangium corydalis TaxID=1441875 RepID=A0ABV9EIW8_9ACTN|nr:TetR/AcrR family transcriptional regulator [Sphaerisporangium corydalis]
MQVSEGPSRRRTFAGRARRAQIVEAAIGVIAELGYGQASFARIAERAGLSSTRLISYHFAGKDELIKQVVAQLYGEMSGHMAERVQAESTPAGAFRTYIQALVGFISAHRARMKALLEIFLNHRDADGGVTSYDAATDLATLAPIEEILRWGQREGEFRMFDTRVMAMTVHRAIDGLPFLLEADPGRDLDAYGEELVTLFDLATRSAR